MQLAPFDRLMTEFLEKNQVPGAALAVVYENRLVLARGYGWSNQEEKLAVEPTSMFRIASLSKPLTAVAIFKLVEAGKLSLDDKVFDLLKLQDEVPEGYSLDPRWREITIDQLLHHTGGWDRDVSFDAMFRAVEIAEQLEVPAPAKPWDVIRYMLGQSLDFDPGHRYAYSNFGYCLLGRVIEKVSGEDYDQFTLDHVLKPLGIHRMRIGQTLLEGRSTGEVHYYGDDEHDHDSVFPQITEKVLSPYGAWHLEAMDSHGAWIASAVDLALFANALDQDLESPLISKQSYQEMFARPAGLAGHEEDGSPRGVYYGCGWSVRPRGKNGRQNQWHTGSLSGTAALMVRRFDGLKWVVLFNARNTPDNQHLGRTIDPLLHKAAEEVESWPDVDLFPHYR